MSKLDLKDGAAKDATLDGTGSVFQSFYARLMQLAQIVNKQYAARIVKGFREWADKTSKELAQMKGDIPANANNFMESLETVTMSNLAAADSKYATKIIHLGKEQHCWHKRFPELQTNLDEPREKNAFLLGGLILILVAVESVANSRFFAGSSEFGLLGGTLIAITISLGNVFIPLGLAFFGHRWFYRHDLYRTFGIVMISLFLLWAFGFNHLVAEYREESLTIPEGTGSSDSGTLNYVLLFAVGTAVAGISFWKMWSFLDPFRQARECLHDFEHAKAKFMENVCANLTAAQTKYGGLRDKIGEMGDQISTEIARGKAEFRRVHGEVIAETNNIFADYHQYYCDMKVDPDPPRPIVVPTKNAGEAGLTRSGDVSDAGWKFSVEGGNPQTHSVGIADAEWRYFADMEKILTDQINTARKEWTLQLDGILTRINALTGRFKTVIIAKLQEWEKQALSA